MEIKKAKNGGLPIWKVYLANTDIDVLRKDIETVRNSLSVTFENE